MIRALAELRGGRWAHYRGCGRLTLIGLHREKKPQKLQPQVVESDGPMVSRGAGKLFCQCPAARYVF